MTGSSTTGPWETSTRTSGPKADPKRRMHSATQCSAEPHLASGPASRRQPALGFLARAPCWWKGGKRGCNGAASGCDHIETFGKQSGRQSTIMETAKSAPRKSKHTSRSRASGTGPSASAIARGTPSRMSALVWARGSTGWANKPSTYPSRSAPKWKRPSAGRGSPCKKERGGYKHKTDTKRTICRLSDARPTAAGSEARQRAKSEGQAA